MPQCVDSEPSDPSETNMSFAEVVCAQDESAQDKSAMKETIWLRREKFALQIENISLEAQKNRALEDLEVQKERNDNLEAQIKKLEERLLEEFGLVDYELEEQKERNNNLEKQIKELKAHLWKLPQPKPWLRPGREWTF